MVTKTSHLPIRYFLALLWAHPILHISMIRVKLVNYKENTQMHGQQNIKKKMNIEFSKDLNHKITYKFYAKRVLRFDIHSSVTQRNIWIILRGFMCRKLFLVNIWVQDPGSSSLCVPWKWKFYEMRLGAPLSCLTSYFLSSILNFQFTFSSQAKFLESHGPVVRVSDY